MSIADEIIMVAIVLVPVIITVGLIWLWSNLRQPEPGMKLREAERRR